MINLLPKKESLFLNIAFVFLVISFFLPFVSTGDFSVSFSSIAEKIWTNVNRELWDKLNYFMIFSILGSLSILFWYNFRWKLLSLVWLFWIYVYLKFFISISEYKDNIQYLLEKVNYLYQNQHISNDMILDWVIKFILSSPGGFIFIVTSLIFIYAGVVMIINYSKLFSRSE